MEEITMPKVTKAQLQATAKYEQKAYFKVLLRIRKDEEEALKAAVEASGESMNGYIMTAVRERMEREKS